MNLSDIQAKGLTKLLTMPGLVPDKLTIHISEVEPGSRSHPPHTHTGTEAFYVLEGQVTVEVDGELQPLGANESMVIDPTRPHGIFNSGSGRTRYMVIIVK
jgi:XRE family transcriptional regulator, regulator of sulfur utilization